MDSIWSDIEDAKEEIVTNTMYITLNLCRVLAYKRESLILSKQEGGEWAMNALPVSEYQKIISDALKEYKTGEVMSTDRAIVVEFAEYMLKEIEREE